MTAPDYQADVSRVVSLLERWVDETADSQGVAWLREKTSAVEDGAPNWQLFTAFSGAPQHVGKRDLDLSDEDLREADGLRSGWHPHNWSTDQAARAILILSYPPDDRGRYVDALEQLFSTADVRESVALYQCLPLLPYSGAFKARAAEGVRSNMTSVFNAVAHYNPYPAEYFDDGAWNQMVLKALFVGSPLFPIVGLDERANPDLARMLVDYAHERWAAQRSVSPELWRPVGPFADPDYLEDLGLVLSDPDDVQQEAAALALSAADTEKANKLLASRPKLMEDIRSGKLTWEEFSKTRVPV